MLITRLLWYTFYTLIQAYELSFPLNELSTMSRTQVKA